MSDLESLYKDIIIDHYKSKKNRRELNPADHHLEGVNPSCGDDIELFMNTNGELIEEVTFHGVGCAICMASANMLCESLKGVTVEYAAKLIKNMKEMLINGEDPDFPDNAADLEALQGIKNFPVRVKCALLSWETLKGIIDEINKEKT